MALVHVLIEDNQLVYRHSLIALLFPATRTGTSAHPIILQIVGRCWKRNQLICSS
jgi:hypothetical protein